MAGSFCASAASSASQSPRASPETHSKACAFCVAAAGVFALSSHAARQSDGAFERHFQELAKVKDDRRRLREEVEALKAENARLRGGEPANERT